MSSIGELTFFLGLQVQQKKDGIFISQDKYVADILKKFDFTTVKAASTPIETNKALNKDEEAEDVDVHLYRSMIGSLMYLTASRPDIMFAVCACARFQVTPKTSHLHAVKRIFRYLKGQPKLGLWYPRDSPFDLEAFSDSDYARASLDRKSTTGGCQFLGKRLISWQCKKQTIVANSTTEAEYVAAANCCGQVKTDDPNITMEKYIRLDDEKARRHDKVYNWETATYGKIWYDEDVHDLRFVETEFPTIVFDDALTSEKALSCEPTVSSLNNDEIDFRISFDESDDEDYMPTVSYFNDLDYFKDFEKEFPAIVYNDALTSKLDFLTEPTVSSQHINEFDLKDETSLSKCDKEEQNVLYFNDPFPFNIIYPDDSKSDKDNDDHEIDIKQSSG
ncbi:uncharacterized mitochondrial protein-like protein, partial [Tanacetum coccineum]